MFTIFSSERLWDHFDDYDVMMVMMATFCSTSAIHLLLWVFSCQLLHLYIIQKFPFSNAMFFMLSIFPLKHSLLIIVLVDCTMTFLFNQGDEMFDAESEPVDVRNTKYCQFYFFPAFICQCYFFLFQIFT